MRPPDRLSARKATGTAAAACSAIALSAALSIDAIPPGALSATRPLSGGGLGRRPRAAGQGARPFVPPRGGGDRQAALGRATFSARSRAMAKAPLMRSASDFQSAASTTLLPETRAPGPCALRNSTRPAGLSNLSL